MTQEDTGKQPPTPDQLLEQYESDYASAQRAWAALDEDRVTLARSLHRLEGGMTALRQLGASTPASRLAAQKREAEEQAKAETLAELKRQGLVAESATEAPLNGLSAIAAVGP